MKNDDLSPFIQRLATHYKFDIDDRMISSPDLLTGEEANDWGRFAITGWDGEFFWTSLDSEEVFLDDLQSAQYNIGKESSWR